MVDAAAIGGYRPDVGAILGAQFSYAGYSVSLNAAKLRGQQCDLIVFARSTVTGQWFARTVRIMVH
jgi:hypothetical protein